VHEETDAANDRVQDVLVKLRATITRTNDDGGIDFEVDSMPGFARERQGKFRSSFFIESDPDPNDANQFVMDHDVVSHGEVQYISGDDGSAIRLLVELPYEAEAEILEATRVARALHAGWASRGEARTDLAFTLGNSGISLPPLVIGDSGIYAYGPWSWGSNFVSPMDMYMFEIETIARRLIDHGPFFALNHAGHGVNSYGLNLAIAKGAVAAFVQHGYGGVYMDPVSALIGINSTYSRLHVLMGAVDAPLEGPRRLIVGSTFRGGYGVVDLDRMRGGASLEEAHRRCSSESQAFTETVAELGSGIFDFGIGASVAW